MSFPTKDYQQSTTEGKNKILARLQQSGMQDLTWYTHVERVTTSIDESVDKKRDGFFTMLLGSIYNFCNQDPFRRLLLKRRSLLRFQLLGFYMFGFS